MAEQEARLTAEEFAHLDPQFDSLEQQHDTRTFGLWVFLMTELMLFGGLFVSYVAYRYVYPGAFITGSQHLNVNLGAINTAVLIISSVMMAFSVNSAQLDQRRGLLLFLLLTMFFGALFLGIKAIEYYEHYADGFAPGINWTYSGADAGPLQMFFVLYFVMTGLHAVHLTVGIGLVGVMFLRAWRGHFAGGYFTPVEMSGLYWHFVDVVWIFLFPMLYLIASR